MTPDEHYRRAESLLAMLGEYQGSSEKHIREEIIAEAQVHATLATINRSTERLVEK